MYRPLEVFSVLSKKDKTSADYSPSSPHLPILSYLLSSRPVCLSVCLSPCLSVCLSVCRPVCLHTKEQPVFSEMISYIDIMYGYLTALTYTTSSIL